MKQYKEKKVNKAWLFLAVFLFCVLQIKVMYAENDREETFAPEAGVAALLSEDKIPAALEHMCITQDEIIYGANCEVLSENARIWREIEEKVGNVAVAAASNYVYVRSDADIESEIVGKAYGDTVVIITGTKENEDDLWYSIVSEDVEGYIRSDLLVTGEALVALIQEGAVEREYIENPEEWTDVLSREEEQALLEAQQAAAAEEAARLEAERIAALQNSSATEEAKEAATAGDTSLLRQQIVDYAMQFLGNQYISGGTSLSGGTDCSGFTCFIYADFGYSIDRTPGGQYSNAGRTISYSEIKPGDIICYGSGRCTHVALYIGNGQIIHSANSRKGVVIYDADYDNIMAVKSILE